VQCVTVEKYFRSSFYKTTSQLRAEKQDLIVCSK
jgi:hypothetical protein